MKIVTIAEHFVFMFNIVFLLCGILTTGCGVILILNDNKASLPARITAFGIVMFIVSFFGACGVIRKNSKQLIAVSYNLILIFIRNVQTF
ncbi:unnamed protein product [Tenebrio molitor]|nr:unnamed protein product [Tenebrio molitor]